MKLKEKKPILKNKTLEKNLIQPGLTWSTIWDMRIKYDIKVMKQNS
jgi:hypothetical protein